MAQKINTIVFVLVLIFLLALSFFIGSYFNTSFQYIEKISSLEKEIKLTKNKIDSLNLKIKNNKDTILFFDKRIIENKTKIIEREKYINNIGNSDSLYNEMKNLFFILKLKEKIK
jgi:peptidoglycan hydrolase CwlO-like protein